MSKLLGKHVLSLKMYLTGKYFSNVIFPKKRAHVILYQIYHASLHQWSTVNGVIHFLKLKVRTCLLNNYSIPFLGPLNFIPLSLQLIILHIFYYKHINHHKGISFYFYQQIYKLSCI